VNDPVTATRHSVQRKRGQGHLEQVKMDAGWEELECRSMVTAVRLRVFSHEPGSTPPLRLRALKWLIAAPKHPPKGSGAS
jgi:hypothetical protein